MEKGAYATFSWPGRSNRCGEPLGTGSALDVQASGPAGALLVWASPCDLTFHRHAEIFLLGDKDKAGVISWGGGSWKDP